MCFSPENYLEENFTWDHFSLIYGGLNVTSLANLRQLKRDILRAINAEAET